MSFRKAKCNKRLERSAWSDWVNQHQHALAATGLPPEVYLDAEHWQDFLENGHLHWHPEDSTGFDFNQLSGDQASSLLRFLEDQYGAENRNPPLLSWLRVRQLGEQRHHRSSELDIDRAKDQ
jgi:hypothetical protein